MIVRQCARWIRSEARTVPRYNAPMRRKPRQQDCRPKRRPSSCPPPPSRDGTLADLVTEYKRDYDHDPLSAIADCESLADAIKAAAGCIGRVPDHQRRVGREVLTKASRKLLRRQTKIEACESFAELIAIVEEATANIYRFGELAAYDTSLRLGAWLGLSPERVYLHAGTRKGARALGLATAKGYLEMDELPDPLQVLEPREVEDFLCIYKVELKGCHV